LGDIEDIILNNNKAPLPLRPIVHKRKRVHEKEIIQEIEEKLPDIMPDMSTDYQGWLEYQKIKWRIQRNERKKRKLLEFYQDGPARKIKKTSGVTAYFAKQAKTLVENHWQILQIVEVI